MDLPIYHHILGWLGAKGSKARRKLREIARQLYAINNGMKLGFLWDVGCLSKAQASLLLDSLKQANLVADTLVVLQIGGDLDCDFGVCDSFHFGSMKRDRTVFIDVSASLAKPRLVQPKIAEHLHATITSLQAKMLSLDRNGGPTKTIKWLANIPTCRTTLYGVFIGYPVVYWYDITVSQENCLSRVPLAVFQVVQKPQQTNASHPLISFSVPAHLLSEQPNVFDAISKWKHATVDRYDLQLFQFTKTFSNVVM
uniref:Uncharacterized protein n=1 Tax=Anopheles albimanus TaxID=7167 RepID=A0A1I8JSI7_ANOAL